MSDLDKMDITLNKVLEDKKKLLEIYVIASGLIIASIQSTSTLITINTSANETIYNNEILSAKIIIGMSNLTFFLFIFLVLMYYMKTFDKSIKFTTFFIVLISIFFSYILTNFVYLQMYYRLNYLMLFSFIFIAVSLNLIQNSILMIELEKINFKIPLYEQLMLKIQRFKNLVLDIILFGVVIYVLYYLSIPILFLKTAPLVNSLQT